ncbi:MAG: DUF285 domain-containing protein [Candidatus Saccharibacteria bacterium]|nr:DUF285 domain-containing protein [Candidatus Saccharibacteria bacterium]
MVKGRTRKFLISGVFGAILMAVFAATFSRGANATQFDMSIRSYMTVDFPAFIFIDASPNYGGIQTADAKLRVSTNEGGYVAIVSANGSSAGADDVSYTDLVNISENAKIPTLISNKTKLDFPVGYWGYSLDGGENYRGMAAYNDENRLMLSSEQGAATTTDFTFGVRVDDVQPAGIYNNTILVTVVPTMEEVPDPTEIRAKALVGANGHLVFVYDDKHYETGDAYVTETVNTAIEEVYYVPTMANSTADIGWRGNTNVQTVDIEESFKYFSPLNTNYWFYGLSNLNKINNINYIDMDRVTSIAYMFSQAGFADEIKDLKVDNVTNMAYAFEQFCYNGCGSQFLDLSHWNTGNVTNMEGMFRYLNGSLSSGSVVSFAYGIENWDVSSVTNMSYMFDHVYYSTSATPSWSFYFDISAWDVSRVTTMSYMFANIAGSVRDRYSISVGVNMDNLDMRNVRNLSYMFYGTASSDSFSLIANNWQLDSATNLANIFRDSSHAFGSYILHLHGWKIRNNVNSFSIGTTYENGANSVDIDLSDWVVANPSNLIKSLVYKSGDASTWKMNFSGWDTSGITDFADLFSGIGYNGGYTLVLDVTGWDTSNVTTMENLFNRSFYNNVEVIGIDAWNTSKVTNMKNAFRGFGGNSRYEYWRNEGWKWYESAGNFDPSNSWLKYGLDNWDFSKVTDMTGMFEMAGINKRIMDKMESSTWNVGRVVSMSRMFYEAGLDTEVDFGNWNVASVADMSEMFSKARLISLSLSGWHTNSLMNMDKMFAGATIRNSAKYHYEYLDGNSNHEIFVHDVDREVASGINMDNFDVTRITSLKELFKGLQTYSGEVCGNSWNGASYDTVCYVNSKGNATISMNDWDIRNVLYMDYMFNVAQSGEPIALDGFSDLDTSNVVSMSHMFENYIADQDAWNYDFSNLDTDNVLDMSYMFANIEYRSSNVNIDLSTLDTSSVLDMNHMFNNAGSEAATFLINFGGDFDTSSVRNMSYMFNNAGSSTNTFTLDLSSFDTSNVQNMSYMLFNAGKLAANFSVNITGWDVSNVYEREYFCDRLELIQPNWQ